MGGERFDTTQPEAYLFGENQDLNFLGNRPVPVGLRIRIYIFQLVNLVLHWTMFVAFYVYNK